MLENIESPWPKDRLMPLIPRRAGQNLLVIEEKMDSQVARQRLLAGLLVVTALAGIGWQIWKWWILPPAVEFDNLRYIRLLATAVSSRSEEMVNKVEAAVQKRFDEGEMSERERGHFQEIFAVVRAGEWERADRECFAFAGAQLSRSRAKPAAAEHSHDHGEHSHN